MSRAGSIIGGIPRFLAQIPLKLLVNGDLIVTEIGDTLSANANPTVGATLTVTQSNNTLSANAGSIVGVTLTVTQSNNTLVASGSAINNGTVLYTEAPDTVSNSGTVDWIGNPVVIWGDSGTFINKSNNNLDITNDITINGWTSSRGNLFRTSGQYYFEIEYLSGQCISSGGPSVYLEYTGIGVCDDSTPAGSGMDTSDVVRTGAINCVGNNFTNGFVDNTTDYFPNTNPGDRAGCAVNLDTQELYLSINGVWIGTSNPITRTNPRFTWHANPGMHIYPICYLLGNSNNLSSARIHGDAATQLYGPPPGYLAWNAWTPLLLPGLTAWYDAQDNSTFVLNGSSIAQWNDKSGNNYNASQITTSKQPVLTGSGINGYQSIYYNGVNNQALVASTPSGLFSSGLAFYFVTNQQSATYSAIPICRTTSNEPNPIDHWDTNLYLGNGSTHLQFTSFTPAINSAAYWGCRYILLNDTYNDWLNGTLQYTYSPAGVTSIYADNSVTFYLGSRIDGSTHVLGYVGEIVVCNQLSDSDRTTLESYLHNKWFVIRNIGTLSSTQANNTLTAIGKVDNIISTLSTTQANETLVSSGGPIIGSALSTTQANEILTTSGKVSIGGTLSVTQGNETLVTAGSVTVGGTLSATQANEILITVSGVTVSGTLSATQGNETLTTLVKVDNIIGTLSATQANETLFASGTEITICGLNLLQANETLNTSGKVSIGATLSATQANETFNSTGKVSITGTLSAAQSSQTVSANGLLAALGTLTVTQTSQTITSFSKVDLLAILNIIQNSQIVVGNISAIVGGTLHKTQDVNTASETGFVVPIQTHLVVMA
jgi:hypothetical protein